MLLNAIIVYLKIILFSLIVIKIFLRVMKEKHITSFAIFYTFKFISKQINLICIIE